MKDKNPNHSPLIAIFHVLICVTGVSCQPEIDGRGLLPNGKFVIDGADFKIRCASERCSELGAHKSVDLVKSFAWVEFTTGQKSDSNDVAMDFFLSLRFLEESAIFESFPHDYPVVSTGSDWKCGDDLSATYLRGPISMRIGIENDRSYSFDVTDDYCAYVCRSDCGFAEGPLPIVLATVAVDISNEFSVKMTVRPFSERMPQIEIPVIRGSLVDQLAPISTCQRFLNMTIEECVVIEQ